MKPKPKTAKELPNFGKDVSALADYLLKHWDGLKNVKPKGFKKFEKGYSDFDGMEEWEDKERDNCEKEFKGFDDEGVSSFNFVRKISLPDVMYGDVCQGRSPLYTLISACVAYGHMRGEIFMKDKAVEDERTRLIGELINLITKE